MVLVSAESGAWGTAKVPQRSHLLTWSSPSAASSLLKTRGSRAPVPLLRAMNVSRGRSPSVAGGRGAARMSGLVASQSGTVPCQCAARDHNRRPYYSSSRRC